MRKLRAPLITAVTIGLLAGSTLGVTAQEQTSVRTDILRGVELVTEAVEPRVLRIVSDGVRDLSIPVVVGEEEAGTYPRTSRIVADRRGRVWLFGPEAFYRLGAAASHEGRAWDTVEVDEQGTIWALLDDGRLETFADRRWDRKATWVLDFDMHPEGSVFMLWEEPTNNGRSWQVDSMGPLRKGDWSEVRRRDASRQKATRPPGALSEGSIIVAPGHDGGDKDSYRGFSLSGGDVDGWAGSKSQAGSFGPLNDDGEVRAMANRSKGGAWFLVRFDGVPTLEDGRLIETPQYWVTRGFEPEQGHLWFEVPGRQSDGRRFSDELVVAPDRSLWLPSDDGLAHFDDETWTWYLRGHAIDDVDIAADGSVWVQAADDETVSTYVIDPEAKMAAE